MTSLIRIAVLLLLSGTAAAQDFCSTVTDESFMARFDALIAAHAASHRVAADTGIIHVPVTFHVEVKSGSPVVGDARLGQAMEATNRWFRGAGVQFVKCDDTRFFPTGSSAQLNRRTVNVALFRQSDGCGYASGSYVFINVACNRTLENILSHELGHVMGLPHTHGYTNMGTTNELVDGSNCATHGDRFCDTPADPNLLGKVSGSCGYTGTAHDANGMAYRPLTDNIMSYTNSACADSLTPMQLARVRAVAFASSYVCCGIVEPLVADTTVCVGQPATLRASTPVGTLAWYDAAEGGSPVGFGPVFTTPPLTAPRAWYVEAADSCVGPRARVIVQVEPQVGVLSAERARLLLDLDTSGSSSPYGFLVIDSMLLFRTRQALWISDGSAEGTRKLAELPSAGEQSVSNILPFDGTVLFGANDRGSGPSLWRADPVSGDVEEVRRFSARDGHSNFWLTNAGEWVLFMLNDGNGRTELWRTDGTEVGTFQITTLPQTNAFEGFGFTVFGGGVLFQAVDSLHGAELWFTDGTDVGTRMVADLWPGPQGSDPGGFVLSDGLVYFSAADSGHGGELWVTDGTAEGSSRISDINKGPASSQVGQLTPLLGSLYFYATDNATNYEAYVSDGTPEGTRLLADLRPDNGSFPSMFTSYRDEVYCVANDGSGAELWALHPKGAAPPRRVRDINPVGGSAMSSMVEWNGLLYFAATDGRHGSELWRSDGTEAGTFMVADIDTLTGQGGAPSELTPFRGGLYFSAFEKSTGRELYSFAPSEFTACGGGAAKLVAGNSKGVVRWYDSEDAAMPLGIGMEWVTGPLPRSRVFWADVTVGACTSLRSVVPVRVIAPEPIVRDTSVAHGSEVELTAFAESGEIEWLADSLAGTAMHSGPRLRLSAVQHDTTLYAATREGDCRSRRVPLHVRVGVNAVDGPPLPAVVDVYPHPVRDRLQLLLPLHGRVEDVVICDMLGREVLRHVVQAEAGMPLRVNVAGLAGGHYVIVLRGRDTQLSVRFLKVE